MSVPVTQQPVLLYFLSRGVDSNDGNHIYRERQVLNIQGKDPHALESIGWDGKFFVQLSDSCGKKSVSNWLCDVSS